MIVCIAEKPSVGRDIARVLGATENKGSYIEGNGYQVTWTFGHLCELKEPHEYNSLWKRWALSQLPMIPPRFGIKLKRDEGIERQFETIARLVREAEYIVNCGDAGQEGELIQRWVIQLTGARRPVKRLWINSLTPEAIAEGFRNLRDQSEYQSLYEAGLCRAIGDWTLGINATRLYTLRYHSYGGKRDGSNILSIGRVQTPTLALIVKRQEEIDGFKPTPYWVLTTLYRDTLFTLVMEEGERGFKTREDASRALASISGLPFTVTGVEKKKGSEAPPRLFDLTSLQVECNKRFDYSADLTLQTIQSLYEKKLTTYPRVDTTFLPDDVYPKCPQILNGLRAYFPLMDRIKGKPLVKSRKVFDTKKVTDHHAIIPTGVRAGAMTEQEGKVYDLICRRFIGVFHPDCKFEATTVTGKAGELSFRAGGKHVTDAGWKALWAKEKGSSDEEKVLPLFVRGESGQHTPSVTEKQTTPPKPFTEGTLLRAMETAGKLVDDEELRDALKENGIGRPSTRAAIIETLFSRQYIRKERKSIVPTTKGKELISLIGDDLLKSAELTGIWEKKLRQIERHEYEASQFIEEMKQMVCEVVVHVFADTSNRHVSAQ
ncbi:MAG: DNA topoisomerase 3 [Prevotellaceae bacterium]|nr:DNA topoisomerase 3 [Prevotellaceae bacterium]